MFLRNILDKDKAVFYVKPVAVLTKFPIWFKNIYILRQFNGTKWIPTPLHFYHYIKCCRKCWPIHVGHSPDSQLVLSVRSVWLTHLLASADGHSKSAAYDFSVTTAAAAACIHLWLGAAGHPPVQSPIPACSHHGDVQYTCRLLMGRRDWLINHKLGWTNPCCPKA